MRSVCMILGLLFVSLCDASVGLYSYFHAHGMAEFGDSDRAQCSFDDTEQQDDGHDHRSVSRGFGCLVPSHITLP